MKTSIRLLSFLRPFFWEICLSILLGMAAIGTGIGLLGTSSFLIASAALHPSIAELQVAIVGVRFFGLSRAVFRYLERLVSHSVNLRVLSHLREWFYQQMETTPPSEFHTYKSGDLLNHVMSDLETLENFYVRVISPVVVAVVVGTGVSLFIGAYSRVLGLILATGLLLNGFVFPLLSILTTRKISRKLVESQARLSAQTVELLQGLEDLQTNGAHLRWMEEIKQKSRESGDLQARISMLNGINSGLSLLMLNLTVLGLLWIAIPMAQQGTISGVNLGVITLIGMASFEAVNSLPQAAVMLNVSIESAKRLFLVAPSKPSTLSSISQPEEWKPSSVKLDGISFEYEGEQTFKLKDISFSLNKGKRVALVGPSGAGKTSLVNLLLRFWEPTEGRILFDGVETGVLDPYRLRSYFSVVSQSTWLFSSSLRENLLLADPYADDLRLLKALEAAELGAWIRHLPQGLNTWLGDQGYRLSGGERQRVAIARATLQDRPFVILDEPLVNLDPVTAQNVLATVFSLFKDQALLFITHDLCCLEKMDEILVIEEGKLVERGDYSQLVKNHGRLASMIDLESQILQ